MAFGPSEDGPMSRKRHKPEEIVSKLRQVDVLVSQGRSVADAIRSIGVTELDDRRHARWRDLLQPAGGSDRDRELAHPLQHQTPACLTGLPATSSRGVRPRHGGLAHKASPRGAKANPQLTFTPDHPMGANQLR